MQRLRIVINADDFGLSEDVTKEISSQFYPKGIVTSTTIMANSNHLAKVKEIVDANPQISFGIHLNITEGLCLSRSKFFLKYHLVDNKWNFIKKSCKELEYIICNTELLYAIYDEWKMQMNTLIAAGIEPDHIDGHHHCHTWYGLSEIAIRIANEYKMNLVRNIITHGVSTMKDKIFATVAYTLYRFRINICNYRGNAFAGNRMVRMLDAYQSRYVYSELLLDNNIRTTDLFCDYDIFKAFVNENHDSYMTIELMCHPGHSGYFPQTQRVSADSYQLHISKNIILSNYKCLLR